MPDSEDSRKEKNQTQKRGVNERLRFMNNFNLRWGSLNWAHTQASSGSNALTAILWIFKQTDTSVGWKGCTQKRKKRQSIVGTNPIYENQSLCKTDSKDLIFFPPQSPWKHNFSQTSEQVITKRATIKSSESKNKTSLGIVANFLIASWLVRYEQAAKAQEQTQIDEMDFRKTQQMVFKLWLTSSAEDCSSPSKSN